MKEHTRPQPASGFPSEGRGFRRYVAFALLVSVMLGGTFAVRYARLSGRPDRFAEVEPGQLYRSAHPSADALKYVLARYRVNAILALDNREGRYANQVEEENIARREGVQLVRISLPESPEGRMLALDKAAEVMADPVNRPLLVHCATGVEQTGAAFAAYRLKYGNWTLEKALEEGDRYGCGIEDRQELVNSLGDYYRQRVLPTKEAASASAPAEARPPNG